MFIIYRNKSTIDNQWEKHHLPLYTFVEDMKLYIVFDAKLIWNIVKESPRVHSLLWKALCTPRASLTFCFISLSSSVLFVYFTTMVHSLLSHLIQHFGIFLFCLESRTLRVESIDFGEISIVLIDVSVFGIRYYTKFLVDYLCLELYLLGKQCIQNNPPRTLILIYH